MDYRRYFRLRGRDELDDELDAHIEMRVEELVARGETPERARAQAVARLGDRRGVHASARQRDRDLKRREHLLELRRDLVLAWRQSRRARGVTALTVLTLGLGVGLTTTMFTFVDHVLLRPLPFPDSERIVLLQGADSLGNPIQSVSNDNYLDWREQSEVLASSALYEGQDVAVLLGEEPRSVTAKFVDAEFFDVLRAQFARGRGFSADDPAGVVVISAGLAQRAGAVRTLRVNGVERPIVGVLASGQDYPQGTEVWQLVRRTRFGGGNMRNNLGGYAIARLAPGVTLEEARTELSAIAARVQASDPASLYGHAVPLIPLHEFVVGDARGYLRLLLGAVCFVLLIGCANLAGLNLARGVGRASEVGVRYALGASRARVLRQLITEQAALAVVGGALGLLLAFYATSALATSTASRVPRAAEIQVDLRVAAFAFALSLVAGLLTAAVPAWRTSRVHPRSLLGGRGTVRGGRGLPGAALVVAEVAMAVLLLAGAGLLIRSFQSVLARDVGFATERVASAEVVLARPAYRESDEARFAFWDRVTEQLRSDPAITDVGLANWIPTGYGGRGFLEVDGHTGETEGAAYRVVGEGYMSAVGIPLLQGRDLDARDARGAPRVALVSRSLSERFFARGEAIGRRIRVPGMEGYEDVPWLTIVGVVGDVRHGGHESDVSDHVYVSYRQTPYAYWTNAMHVVARGRASEREAAAAIRRVVHELDRELVVEPVELADALGSLVSERRLIMSVLTLFGVLALALAAIGLYGMLSFAVAQRTHEIGVRAALGASHAGIVGMVVASAGRVVAIGAVIGLVASYWLTRLLESMLADVSRVDVLTYAAAALLLGLVALAAALVPARRAARVEPLRALQP